MKKMQSVMLIKNYMFIATMKESIDHYPRGVLCTRLNGDNVIKII